MGEVETVVRLFPRKELAVRRAHARDTTFRAVCCDLCEALRALHYWEMTEAASGPRVRQYREMVSELENEVASLLEDSGCGSH